jgi:stage II sporulation protein D
MSKGKTVPVGHSLMIEPDQGHFRYLGRLYRGKIELRSFNDWIYVINHVDVDSYVTSVVGKEITERFPDEAIKAQIIAARSYALATAADRRRSDRPFDLYCTQKDQVYLGMGQEFLNIKKLVEETRGEVLYHQEHVLKAYFHAASGGFSELPQNVWDANSLDIDRMAFRAEPSPYDHKLAYTKWKITLSPEMGALIPDVGEILDLRVLKRSEGRRVQEMEIRGKKGWTRLKGTEFRDYMGTGFLKSTYFFVKRVGNLWNIEGAGWGHGVGMSQWGAKSMAHDGKSAKQILSFYYPFSNVRKLSLDN